MKKVTLVTGLLISSVNLFAQSEAYLLKALDCGYPSKNLLMQLGISYGGQKKFLQSLITFKETLKFSLEDPILHYQIGIIYKELQNNKFNDKAISEIVQVISYFNYINRVADGLGLEPEEFIDKKGYKKNLDQ